MKFETYFASLEPFAAVQTTQALTRQLERACGLLGFDTIVQGLQSRNGMEGAVQVMSTSVVSSPWHAHYIRQKYYEIDPRMQHCARRLMPIPWSIDSTYQDPRERQMAEEQQDFGVRAGIFAPTHTTDGRFTVICVGLRNVPHAAAREVLKHAQPLLPTLGAYAHEALTRIHDAATQRRVKPAIPLTRRERDCLQWAAVGKTSWEIGQVLHITERTANFHLGNAMTKLGCHSRQHAIVKALGLRLIQI